MKTILVSFITLFILSQNSIPQDLLTKNPPIKLEDVSSIFTITEEKICNPNFMETDAWKAFKVKLTSKQALLLSKKEYVKLFNNEAKNLPFTHYRLKIPLDKSTSLPNKEAFLLEKLTPDTMLLTIRYFSSDAGKMQTILDTLQKTNYKNLIIDLRNNPGGTLDAAVPLVQYLSNKVLHGGYFISRSWFEKNKNYPTLEQLQQFTPLMNPTYKGFTNKMKNDIGMSLIIPPNGKPVFTGNLYVLTNGGTGSACEPLVFGLKNSHLGTIVGEKTAGAMLSGYEIKINDSFTLFMPLADYVTVTNQRLDKVGVKPDIKIRSDLALPFVLDSLIAH